MILYPFTILLYSSIVSAPLLHIMKKWFVVVVTQHTTKCPFNPSTCWTMGSSSLLCSVHISGTWWQVDSNLRPSGHKSASLTHHFFKYFCIQGTHFFSKQPLRQFIGSLCVRAFCSCVLRPSRAALHCALRRSVSVSEYKANPSELQQ